MLRVTISLSPFFFINDDDDCYYHVVVFFDRLIVKIARYCVEVWTDIYFKHKSTKLVIENFHQILKSSANGIILNPTITTDALELISKIVIDIITIW